MTLLARQESIDLFCQIARQKRKGYFYEEITQAAQTK